MNRYIYLAHPEKAVVERLIIKDNDKLLDSKIQSLVKSGYHYTYPEMYRRFKRGHMTQNSFIKKYSIIVDGKKVEKTKYINTFK